MLWLTAYCAGVYRRRGEWERSLADSQRAEELDPRDPQIPINIGFTYLALRQWKDAERAEFRGLALDPHNALAASFFSRTRLNSTGDVGSARRALDGFPEAHQVTHSRQLPRRYWNAATLAAFAGRFTST